MYSLFPLVLPFPALYLKNQGQIQDPEPWFLWFRKIETLRIGPVSESATLPESIKRAEKWRAGFQVIAETRNTVNETKNATRHAEINAVDVVEALGMCIILLFKRSTYLVKLHIFEMFFVHLQLRREVWPPAASTPQSPATSTWNPASCARQRLWKSGVCCCEISK